MSKRKRFAYSEKDMELALEAVETGVMSKRRASIFYKVPRTTLLDKLEGRTPRERRLGAKPFLTDLEESEIVQ